MGVGVLPMTSDWIDTSHGHGSDWEQRVRQLRVVMTEQRCKEPHFNAAYLCCWTLMIGEMMMLYHTGLVH